LILYNWKWLIEPFNRFSVDLRSNVYSDSATALGAALFMALALGSAKSQKALERPGFQWLGKVSYSLYLIHPLVLMTCVYAFFGIFPLPLSVALALGLSLFFSEYFYRWVERPSMEWGRKLSETTGPALRRLING
jgi:peptidoglycan/LPS O-acetylase OafA/YrhL